MKWSTSIPRWYQKSEIALASIVKDANTLSVMRTIRLLSKLLSLHTLTSSPSKREYHSPHQEIGIGIGDDHSATLTIDNDALDELYKMMGVIPEASTKDFLVRTAKQFRAELDDVLQDLKQHRCYLTSDTLRETHQVDHEDHGEAIANLTISIREVESAIMRLGMVLKHTGNPNPYPTSKDPSTCKVEPTADNLKL